MLWLTALILPYFTVFAVTCLLLVRKDRDKNRDTGGDIRLSLIIPVRNEASSLPQLLADLSGQSLDKHKYEIIIVDDASEDASPEIIKNYRNNIPDLKIINGPGQGKKKALEAGLKEAEGNYIITTDADCRVQSTWLEEMCYAIEKNEPDMLIGAVNIINTGGLFNRFVQLEFLALQGVTEAFARIGRPVMCNGANLCFRKPDINNYPEIVKDKLPSGDDIFLMEKYKKESKKIRWTDREGTFVETKGADSLRDFFRQRARWSSKSIYYTDPLLIAIALLVFLSSSVIVATIISAIFYSYLWPAVALMYILKTIPDICILSYMCRKRKRQYLLGIIVPAQLLYPFYIVSAGTAGLIRGLSSLPKGK